MLNDAFRAIIVSYCITGLKVALVNINYILLQSSSNANMKTV